MFSKFFESLQLQDGRYLDAFTRSIDMFLGIQIRVLFVHVVVECDGAVLRKVVRVFFRVQGLTVTIRSSNEPTCVWGLSIEKPGTVKISAVPYTYYETQLQTLRCCFQVRRTLPYSLCTKI
jgi:hypothetical protein